MLNKFYTYSKLASTTPVAGLSDRAIFIAAKTIILMRQANVRQELAALMRRITHAMRETFRNPIVAN